MTTKNCKHCGKELVPHMSGKRMESSTNFKKRKLCNNICALEFARKQRPRAA